MDLLIFLLQMSNLKFRYIRQVLQSEYMSGLPGETQVKAGQHFDWKKLLHLKNGSTG